MNEEIITISDTDSSEQSMFYVQVPLQQSNIQVKQMVDNSPAIQSVETNIISLSSQSLQPRCPVSWQNSLHKQKLKYFNSETFCTPSPKAKVSDWLFATNQATNDKINEPGNFSLTLKPSYIDNKSSILIRQDYRKPDVSVNIRSSSLNENSNDNTMIHIDNCDFVGSNFSIETNNTCNQNLTLDSVKETELPINLVNLSQETVDKVENNCLNLCDTPVESISVQIIETKSNNSPIDLEIPNKVELCEYLKLMNMNPTRKIDGLKQNRRSSRVKNLAILSERRALERELNSNSSDQEKKKSSVDLEIHSSVGSDSSKESSRLSQKSEAGLHRSRSKRNSLSKELNNGDDLFCIMPTKSLQVPEVSTTSLLRRKSVGEDTIHNDENYSNNNHTLNQDDKSVIKKELNKTPNSFTSNKSVIMTKKSFCQLKIDVNNLRDPQKGHNYHYRLLNYFHTRPQMDYDDFYSAYMHNLEVTENQKKNVNNKIVKNLKKPKKTQISIKTLKTRLRKKFNVTETAVKSKLRPTKERLKVKRRKELRIKRNVHESLKGQRKLKFYLRKRELTKLRSRGKLKEVGIKSILLDHDKRRKMKKKFRVKSTQVTPKRPEKHFLTAELIQTGLKTSPQVVATINGSGEEENKIDVPLCQTEFLPTKLLRLKSDIDMLKNLTPEHRKALFESKKFLIGKTKDNTLSKANRKISTSVEESVNTDQIEKADKTTETVEQCDISEPPKLVHVALQTQTEMEFSRPCSEDVEVDKLMNRDRFKTILGNSKSAEDDLATTVLKDQSPCESESSKSQTTTHSSLDVASSNRESIISAPNGEIPDLFSPTEVLDLNDHIIEEIVESNALEEENDVKMDEDCSDDLENEPEVINISEIKRTNIDRIHVVDDNEAKIKSLHQCLIQRRKKLKERNDECDQDWGDRSEPESSTKNDKKVFQSYAIELSRSNGAVINAYYLDFNLVVVQELLISFWNQTSLGNVLGAQDMWMPKGYTKRLVLGNGCICQDSSETIMVLDTCIAYFELWTKEHKSDKRERPVADIFVTIYFRLSGVGPDKKVLQLENIHGYANDVQYIVIKNSPIIVVSWNTINDQLTSTVVHKYRLSPDYQAVTDITSMQAAAHYISSLHNIEDSDTLIMGCGEDKITLWHIDHGYIVATMDLMAIAQQPRTLWAKADRGFIFTLHNFNDGHLHLIATNSFDYSWKQLQVYKQQSDYENLLGICIDDGLVVAFYETGVLCWSAKSGELVIDTPSENSIFLPFGKHIILMVGNQVEVRSALEFLLTMEDGT